MSENEDNVKDSRIKRYNYIYNYISKEKKRRRIREYLLRLDPQVYSEFRRVAASKFGLHYGANILVEALMKMFVEEFKDSPIIQTTLFCYKPQQVNIHQNIKLNLAQKLELKLIKQDLTTILNGLQHGKGDKNFYLSRLREVLPKAIRLYEKTENHEIAELLEKSERWIER